jgi:hypothetical protein
VRGAQLISSRIRGYLRRVPALTALTSVAAVALAQAPGAPGMHAGEHQHLDSRFAHNRYYYDRGYAVHSPPDGGLANLHGPDGQRYYYHGADWYQWKGTWDQSWHWQRWYHGGWVVSAAPAGLLVPLLPPAYTVVWWGRTPYYYANDTYYIWDASHNAYQVVAPPAGLDAAGTTPAPVTAGASDQMFAEPTKGQSADQQAHDRADCSQWSVAESGYDPTAANAATQDRAKRDAYFRAQAACLDARGYAVK